MAPAVTASVTELPESRVRVRAEVDPAEVERHLQQAARAIGREMRIPGFRKGKVPPPIVIRRVGRPAVLDEAVRGALGEWYADAIDAAGIVPVGDPQLDMGELPPAGSPLTFSIEIGVRPIARLGSYRGLEVGRREPTADDERVESELQAMRERLAKLDTAERPAQRGDFVVIDYAGTLEGEPFDGGEGRDQLVELGSGRLVPGFEEGLQGAGAGEERTVTVTFPADYGAEQLAGREAAFAVTVKEVKAKVLPELDDEFASDAAGLDTLAELRADIVSKVQDADRRAVEGEFREAAVDAAVAQAAIDVPEGLVEARAHELWHSMVSTLGRQGISEEAYLRISGKTAEEVVEEAKPDAEQALKREAVLAAIVAAEGIEPSDAELEQALEHSAEHEDTTPSELLARLRRAGRLEALREDVATRQAVELLAGEARAIPLEQALARERLWTPEHEGSEAGSQPAEPRLWTPGS